MAVKFIPSLRKCFDLGGYGKDNAHDSQLLVVVNGTAYELGENFDMVRDNRGIYALGSGGHYALGAMFSQVENQKRTVKFAKEVVQSALITACTLDPGSAEPVMIMVQHRTPS
jgi:ATP-dependent protease HslVU (ClpYQ) peptidase subunit